MEGGRESDRGSDGVGVTLRNRSLFVRPRKL